MTRYIAGAGISAGACVVYPIERVDVESAGDAAHRRWVSGQRVLHAFVIRDHHGVRGFDAQGLPVALVDLVRQVPALAPILQAPAVPLLNR